ncbi:MAG: clostripain-related cysteine peptidase [Candidatus Riflebacteria bacterium]|nr:clostripain-related cysteine peptidase [Candidatus Riflebacteria bacterium]
MCGCITSSHRPATAPANDEVLLNINGVLSFSNIGFHYSLVEHNTNTISKAAFSISIEDETTESIVPDVNGAYTFTPISTRKHAVIYAKKSNQPNLTLEAALFTGEELSGEKNVEISLNSTAQSLIFRYLRDNYGQLINPLSISDSELLETAEAIAFVLEQRPEKLASQRLDQVAEVKAAFIAAADKIFKAGRGQTLYKHVLLAYAAGDNDLHSKLRAQCEALAKAGEQSQTAVLIFSDLYETGASISKLNANTLIELEKIGKIDSTDPSRLKSFIEKYRRAYPAAHYTLYIGSHGDAWRPTTNLRGWLLQDTDTAPPYGAKGNLIEIARTIESSIETFTATKRPFGLLILDACNMGGIEVAYELKNCAERTIFSQAKVPANGIPIQTWLTCAPTEKTPKAIGSAICDAYKAAYIDNRIASTITMINNSELQNFIQAFDQILNSFLINDEYYTHAFGELANNVAEYNEDESVKRYVLQAFENIDYRDIGHLMSLIHDVEDNPQMAFSWEFCDVAQNLYSNKLIEAFHAHGFRDATGLFITFPKKSVYNSEYIGNSPIYHSYFSHRFCQNTKWPDILSEM